MWCAFEGPPRIVRFHRSATVVVPGERGWDELSGRFPADRGAPAVIVVEIQRVADTCGYAVPLMESVGERSHLTEWADARTDEELAECRRTRNASTIDGLPAP